VSTALAPSPTSPAVEVLARVENLRLALSEPGLDFTSVANIRDHAEVLHAAAKAARLGLETANHAKEIQIRAERRCGELLLELMATASTRPLRVLPNGTLDELGINNFQSARYQQLARMTAHEFEARIDAIKDAQRELSFAAFVRAARPFVRPQERRASSTETVLHNVLRLLREVTKLRTPAEVELARQVVTVTRGWDAALRRKAATAPTRPDLERRPTCVLCGREQPASLPPRCQVCGGAWLTV
jgi:hypothetical protein